MFRVFAVSLLRRCWFSKTSQLKIQASGPTWICWRWFLISLKMGDPLLNLSGIHEFHIFLASGSSGSRILRVPRHYSARKWKIAWGVICQASRIGFVLVLLSILLSSGVLLAIKSGPWISRIVACGQFFGFWTGEITTLRLGPCSLDCGHVAT